MFQKLAFLCILLVPALAFGQNAPTLAKKLNHEITFSNLSSGNLDEYVSFEFRWNTNKPVPVEKENEKLLIKSVRFVPGVEVEYFHDSANLQDGTKIDRYNHLTWLKGYVDFRPEKKIRPYIGLALGLYNGTAIMGKSSAANSNEAMGAARNIDFAMDFPIGIRFYPHQRLVMIVGAKFWRPSLNGGIGFNF